MSISETVSQKPRRGRPRSWRTNWADDSLMRNTYPEGYNCPRSRINWTLLVSAIGLVKESLSEDEQAALFGVPWERIDSIGGWPRGWPSVAYEIGRLADDDKAAAVECLRAVSEARSKGIPWGACRAHVRTMRLGRRKGSAVALLLVLCRALDAYRTQYPGTTSEQTVGAAQELLSIVQREGVPEE